MRSTMVSQPRSGTSAEAHEPKTASPLANRPPKTASATIEIPAVRSTGQSIETRLVAEKVRPSSGSPRIAESGQAIPAATWASSPCARVRPAAVTTAPARTASVTTPSASRSTVVRASTAASTPHATVHGWLLFLATTHMSDPASSRTAAVAIPMSR